MIVHLVPLPDLGEDVLLLEFDWGVRWACTCPQLEILSSHIR
jgi:hypothetical protein